MESGGALENRKARTRIFEKVQPFARTYARLERAPHKETGDLNRGRPIVLNSTSQLYFNSMVVEVLVSITLVPLY